MSLKETYEKFLASPSIDALAADIALNYITTTTTITSPEAVINHLRSQKRILQISRQEIYNVVEGPASIALEADTTLELEYGGGAYLLDLDDNFLTGRSITFPIVHFVHFDGEKKITQIRLYWDQSTVLRQLDVIGYRHRAWPIKSSTEQLKLIKTSVITAEKHASASSKPAAAESMPASRATTTSDDFRPSTRSSRASSRPIRDPIELFGVDEGDYSPEVPRKYKYKADPKKFSHFEFGETPPPSSSTKPLKKGMEHFEFGEAPHTPVAPSKPGLPHFEFGEADPSMVEKPRMYRSTNHESHWDFEDFSTPVNPKTKPVAHQALRHFGWNDHEYEHQDSPIKPTRTVRPRRDAETHFELHDDGESDPKQKPKSSAHGSVHDRRNLDLYGNGLYGDEYSRDEPQAKVSLVDMTNGTSRRKNLDNHWVMQDPTPENVTDTSENKPKSGERTKTLAYRQQHLSSHWEMEDPTPDNVSEARESKPKSDERTKTLAYRQQHLSSHWEMEDPDTPKPVKTENRPIAPGRQRDVNQMSSSWDMFDEDVSASAPVPPRRKNFRDPNQRSWGFGDEGF